MQDGCAVRTPALFRCLNIGPVAIMVPNINMVPGHIKLNGLFAKKSICKGATAVLSQPGDGSDASLGTSRKLLQ